MIVKSGVMSIQPSANELAGVNNKSKKSTAIGVVIFVFARNPRAPFEPYILFDYVLRRQAVGTETQPKRRSFSSNLRRSRPRQKKVKLAALISSPDRDKLTRASNYRTSGNR